MEHNKYVIWLDSTAQDRGLQTADWLEFLQEEAAKFTQQPPIRIRLDTIYNLVQSGEMVLPPEAL